MRNNKGFTLIELLAVIVILVAISAIAIPSITASIERSKIKQRAAKIETIVSEARLYYSTHKARIISGDCYITLDDLGLDDSERENPTGGTFDGVVVYRNATNNFEYYDDYEGISKCVR